MSDSIFVKPHPDELKIGAADFSMERFDKGVSHHKGKEYVSDDLLNMVRHVEVIYMRYQGNLVKPGIAFKLDEEIVAEKLRDGFPLLNISRVNFDYAGLEGLLVQLSDMAAMADPSCRQALKAFSMPYQVNPEKLANLVAVNLPQSQTDLEKEIQSSGLSPEVYLFIADHIGRAALIDCASKLERYYDPNLWHESFCPICGNNPGISVLVEHGSKRLLRCSACRFAWEYKYPSCPSCGNNNPETLATLKPVGKQNPHSLDTCKRCNSYIKSFDFQLADPKRTMVLEVEDPATLFLDLKAEEEGFQRC